MDEIRQMKETRKRLRKFKPLFDGNVFLLASPRHVIDAKSERIVEIVDDCFVSFRGARFAAVPIEIVAVNFIHLAIKERNGVNHSTYFILWKSRLDKMVINIACENEISHK
jgi:hypothetical protein